MPYKIGIDMTYIVEDSQSGIRKHGEEIIEELSKNNEIILFVNKKMGQIYRNKFTKCKIVLINRLFENVRIIRRINNSFFLKEMKKKLIDKQKCDIIFYPYVDKHTAVVDGERKIITILDLIPLEMIEDKNSNKYMRIKRENINMMNKSKYIVTISEYSKQRLLELNPNYNGEITVIPSPINKLEKVQRDISEIIHSHLPYIFSINSFYRHKNQITLVKAFNKIKGQIPHKLILVGRPELDSNISGYTEIVEYIKNNNLEDRIDILSYISDEDRNALFYNADLFVTTSLMEGFGRTPVEAALCQIPVISTKAMSLPEVTLNGVTYYENATDENELAQKILEVINNKPSAESLEKLAKKMEQSYKAETVARKYNELIRRVVEGDKNAKN